MSITWPLSHCILHHQFHCVSDWATVFKRSDATHLKAFEVKPIFLTSFNSPQDFLTIIAGHTEIYSIKKKSLSCLCRVIAQINTSCWWHSGGWIQTNTPSLTFGFNYRPSLFWKVFSEDDHWLVLCCVCLYHSAGCHGGTQPNEQTFASMLPKWTWRCFF